ncbi:MAG: hypothetical protein AB7D57_02445 [Desulfovibrionaceae bacterium]
MQGLLTLVTYAFDPLHHFWEQRRTQRAIASGLVVAFLAALLCVELNRRGLLPESMHWFHHTSHFYAVHLAFTLVLVLEVVHLVFALPCSISRSVGTQFEILSLILIRSAFKKLSAFDEPISLVGHLEPLYQIVAAGAAALVVFALLGVYRRLYHSEEEFKSELLFRFVASKKLVALLMLGTFVGMGAYNAWIWLRGGAPGDFFQDFYTVLIFADILLVLVAQRYQPRFRSTFRNSGFVLATLLIRLALTAPPYVAECMGMGSVAYAIGLTWVYNRFYRPQSVER